VREAIVHGETGRLTGFFDLAALADEVCSLLDDPRARARLGAAAREHARRHYDLRTVCLPGQVAWAESLAEART
jgi:glycosyltransferase involved in cell wall biosynthesis